MNGEESRHIKDTPSDSLKDISSKTNSSSSNSSVPLSYTKINKLITALYMVTDIMDNEEPIRLHLRTLGAQILSDSIQLRSIYIGQLNTKVATVLSFLGIACDLNMVSEMNYSILRKEFFELKKALENIGSGDNVWLEEFMSKPRREDASIGHQSMSFRYPRVSKIETPEIDLPMSFNKKISHNGHKVQYIGRLGVQKADNFMNVLKKATSGKQDFNEIKNKRREDILSVIKDIKDTKGIDGATITDIRNNAKGTLIDCGEKTLQRELVSMLKDNVLYKKGDKRWSQYFISA